jgi:arginine deiminase
MEAPMIQVHSEVGRLRQVLMHRPGVEVDAMVPSMMEELLFDDILFGDVAREEHLIFRRVLEKAGVEVLEAEDLLVETLAVEEARGWIARALGEDLPVIRGLDLSTLSPAELASLALGGLRLESGLRAMEADDLFALAPAPNWCFQRDPLVALGDGVLFSSMATEARWRETLLAGVLFRHHPRWKGTPIWHDPQVPADGAPLLLGLHRPHYEGGDVLVLSEDVLAVGLSERTNQSGIRTLVKALHRREGAPRWMLVAVLPRRRAYMHLDTVFTPVDRNACLVHAPVMLPGSSEEVHVYEIDLHAEDPFPGPRPDLLGTLARHGLDLEPIRCGGSDPVAQQREQWTDGANAFALAPGVIALYDRNVATVEELDRHGFAVRTAEEILEAPGPLELEGGRTCILLPSHELSRARGGPHCLTHPLRRDRAG